MRSRSGDQALSRSLARSSLALGFLAALAAAASEAQAPAGVRSGPPSWVADAVFYEILPDRFRNGDPGNDPRPADLRGAPAGDAPRDWRVAPWTASFYALLPWERAAGRDFYGAPWPRAATAGTCRASWPASSTCRAWA